MENRVSVVFKDALTWNRCRGLLKSDKMSTCGSECTWELDITDLLLYMVSRKLTTTSLVEASVKPTSNNRAQNYRRYYKNHREQYTLGFIICTEIVLLSQASWGKGHPTPAKDGADGLGVEVGSLNIHECINWKLTYTEFINNRLLIGRILWNFVQNFVYM